MPIPRITRCPLDIPAHADRLCPLHQRLDEAAALIEKSFRESTVADMTVRPVFTDAPSRTGDEDDARGDRAPVPHCTHGGPATDPAPCRGQPDRKRSSHETDRQIRGRRSPGR